MPMMFDNRTAKACVYFLADIKPSVLKNNTRVVQHLLNAYLNISEKKRPALKGEVCRILARAFMKKKMKYPHLKPGPLVTCMNRTAKEIVDDPDSLKEIAKKKGSKALKREIVKELVSNPVLRTYHINALESLNVGNAETTYRHVQKRLAKCKHNHLHIHPKFVCRCFCSVQ